MAYRRDDINNHEYEEFWEDRQSPENKKITNRNAEQARWHEQEC